MQMIDLMKRLAELDAKNSNVVKESASQLVPGKFYVVTGGRFGGDRAVAGPFDDDGEAEYEKAEYSQGGKGDAAVAQWTNKGWNFDYMMEQGVAEGSPGDYTFTTALNGMLGDDKEFEVTYHYSKGEAPRGYGSLPSDGGPASVEIISVKDLETGQDVSVKNVGKDIWAEFEEEAWYDYKENQQHNNFQDPEYDRDDRYESLAECGMMGGGMSQPRSPASINMTAASGEELSGMLKDIMSLAGLHKLGQDDLGHDHEPAVLSTEPGMSISKVDSEPLDMKSMIAKMDSMNTPSDLEVDDEEEKVNEYDNEPNLETLGMSANINPPGNGIDRQKSQHPMAAAKGDNPLEATYESLMADYRKFMAESEQAVAEKFKGPGHSVVEPEGDLADRSGASRYTSQHMLKPIPGRTRPEIDPETGKTIHRIHTGFANRDKRLQDIRSGIAGPKGHLPEESVEESPNDQEMRNSAYTMTLDQFVSVYGEENKDVWYEENSQEESLNDFFSNLRSEVEQGMNVVDTFHDKVDQLPSELPDHVVQFLRDQSAEADGAQDNPEEMKSIMLAAIDKVEDELGLKNPMEQGMEESLDILKLAGLR